MREQRDAILLTDGPELNGCEDLNLKNHGTTQPPKPKVIPDLRAPNMIHLARHYFILWPFTLINLLFHHTSTTRKYVNRLEDNALSFNHPS